MAEFSNISNLGTNWLGWVRFDFGRVNVNANNDYYPTLNLTDYTRDGENRWIGWVFDTELTNTPATVSRPAAAMEFYGFR